MSTAVRAAPFLSARKTPWRPGGADLVALLVLLPLAAAAIGSFGGAGGESGYARWWGTMRGWTVLGRTVKLASLASAIAVAMGWCLAAAAVRCSRRLAGPVVVLSFLPMLIPSATLATAWIVAAGRQSSFGQILASAGWEVYSLPAAAAVLAMRYFGIATAVLTHQQMQQLSHWSAAAVFRVSPPASWVHLRFLPVLRAAVVAGLIVMLFCMNDHIIPEMLLVSVYAPLVMIQYSALQDSAGAAAIAVPVAGATVAVVAAGLWLVRRGWTDSRPSQGAPPPPAPLPRRLAAGAVVILLLGAALGMPLAVLAVRAGSWRAVVQEVRKADSETGQTLFCALAAAAICTAIGALLGQRWVRCRRTGRPTAAPLVLLNLAVPATLPAMGMIKLFQAPLLCRFDGTSLPLIAAYGIRFVPVAALGFYALWRHESELDDLAARVHGVSWWRRAWRVTFPRRRKALLAVGVLCGLLAATELEMSILLCAPGKATLGTHLNMLIHTSPDWIVSALTLGILALTAPGIVLLLLLLRGLR